MKTRISILSVVCLISCFVIAGLSTPVNADYDYYGDRLSREHRVASDVDEWIERGNATITASPRFEDGVRLTAWANDAQNTDNYEFAIASAVYLFEIPAGTQYIEVLVRYRGEPHRLEIEDYDEPIAGRAWIRNTKREATRSGYYDENAKETRYGDTFVLRAKNRSEHIKIPAAGHVKDGWMELHIVAEGGEQIDVEYLEVSTYRRQPKVRVIQRYTPTYRWRPWHRYTYLYFYDGPVYYATDYDYYLRWSYPIYDHHYLSIRSYYGGYLGRYRGYYPSAYYRYYSPYYGSYHSYYRGTPKVYQRRTQLNRWSAQHETTRRQYSRSRLSANSQRENRTAVRRSVRTTLENHRKQTPATTERVARQSIITQKLRARASTSALRQNNVRKSSYAAGNTGSTLSKQRRYSTATTQNVNRYRRSETQRTTPLYRRSTSSSTRSFSSSTSSNSRPQYRTTTSDSRSSRSRSSVSRSTTSSSRERSSVSRSSSSSNSSRSRSSVSRSSSSTKTRTRPTTSSSSSRSSSSSSSDDDDDDRSRTTQRTKRRR
ncbi:hypothetical protein F4Z99_16320 [Candidatus Poribacteria bacterium]|nr:hypothetical protein [Candidatus Poribacteria bacterium]MYA98688.1 hypothetical protein [Candidatus Poribacteria bacterium]